MYSVGSMSNHGNRFVWFASSPFDQWIRSYDSANVMLGAALRMSANISQHYFFSAGYVYSE